MILTPFRVHRLRASHGIPDFSARPFEGDEVAAWMRGEGACANVVKASVSKLEKIGMTLVLPDDDEVVVNCIDGEFSFPSKESYERRFLHPIIGDVVSVPFPMDVVRSVLYGEGLLITCINCIDYLRPVDVLYYFYFDTRGTSVRTLKALSMGLTTKHRHDMMTARLSSSDTLPYSGNDIGILAHILEVHNDYDNLSTLFASHPSYLTLLYSFSDCKKARELLMTTDYSQFDEYRPNLTPSHVSSVINILKEVITTSRVWSETKRALTMLRLHHPLFENDGDTIIMPFFFDVREHELKMDCERMADGIHVSLLASGVKVECETVVDVLLSLVKY